MNVNAGGWIFLTLVFVVAFVAGAIGSMPRLGRCKAELETSEHGTVRCKYRAEHMQSRHFWMHKEATSRSSVEWRDE